MNPNPEATDSEAFQYEAAYGRIEAILEELNSGNVSLDRSLTLYEEADRLILGCNARLNEAEQRIATLIKARNGELALDPQGQPRIENWQAQQPNPNHPQ